MKLSYYNPLIYWGIRAVPALILIQTLYFKFTAHPGSVAIFTAIEAEPWGRIFLGVAELVTAIMIMVPAISWLGALTAVIIMMGALVTHFIILGVAVNGDGGVLFIMAWAVLVLSVLLVYLERKKVPFFYFWMD